jgi:hypothetical protein
MDLLNELKKIVKNYGRSNLIYKREVEDLIENYEVYLEEEQEKAKKREKDKKDEVSSVPQDSKNNRKE